MIGVTLVLLSALSLMRAYSAFLKKRRAEGEELYSFLLHICSGVRRSLGAPRELADEFSSSLPSVSSFLSLAASGTPLGEAYSSVSFSLGEKLSGEFFALFSGFGRGYLDSELARLDDYSRRISEMLRTEGEESEKSERCVRAVIFAVALGIVILLI